MIDDSMLMRWPVVVAIIISTTCIPTGIIVVIACLKQGTIPLQIFRIAVVSFINSAASIKLCIAIIKTLCQSWTIQEEEEEDIISWQHN